jgi:CRISPR-associated RAMP protein (TIGR02581 family)
MHKMTLNRARLDLRITPVTPLLVKSGDKGATLLHPERPDLMCVRTRDALGETVYVPGSSIKGVIRSASERVLRSLGVDCCDPMDQTNRCHKEASELGDDITRDKRERGEAHPMGKVFKKLCFACRTFGSQAAGSRVFFADAYPPADPESRRRTNQTETRSGVSIDRQTGGPSAGKLFELEVVTGGAFDTSIHLSNYELWQLALLAIVLRDVSEGFVRFGSAKSRGLGRVDLRLTRLLVDQMPPPDDRKGLAGIGALRPDIAAAYGLIERDVLDVETEPAAGAIGQRFDWNGHETIDGVFSRLLGKPWERLCGEART